MIRRNVTVWAMFAAMLCCSCSATSRPSGEQVSEEQKDTTKHITLLFAGDLMQHLPQVNAAKQKDGSYDFNECFDYIREEVSAADVAIANFEITTAGPPYTGYPRFGAPDEYVTAAKNAGFDILTTANNHCCDRSEKGIDRTISVMDTQGIPHLGTYVSQEAKDKQYPYLLESNGFRIVLLDYTYGTNGLPVPSGKVVNLIDSVQIAKDIAKAKTMNPDAIIAMMHWGVEYTMKPIESQVKLTEWMLEQGVTHIIGGHPHVVEPVEVRTDSQGEKHVVAYSLGNFISNQTPKANQPKDGGMMVKLELVKDSTTHVANCGYCLQWVSRPVVSGHKQYRIYPVNIDKSLLNSRERKLMDNFLNTVRPMFKKSNKGDVKEYANKLKK